MSLLSIGIPIIAASIGYCLSWIKEKHQYNNNLARRKKIEYIERRLQYLLWPLFFHLTELMCAQSTQTVESLHKWHESMHTIIETQLYLCSNYPMVNLIVEYMTLYTKWVNTSHTVSTFPFATLHSLSELCMTSITSNQSEYGQLLTEQGLSLFEDTSPDDTPELIAKSSSSDGLHESRPDIFVAMRTQMRELSSDHSVHDGSIPNPYMDEYHALNNLQKI